MKCMHCVSKADMMLRQFTAPGDVAMVRYGCARCGSIVDVPQEQVMRRRPHEEALRLTSAPVAERNEAPDF